MRRVSKLGTIALFGALSVPAPVLSQTTTKLTKGETDWKMPSGDLRGVNLVYMKGNDVYVHNVRRGAISPIACGAAEATISPSGSFVALASGGDLLGTNIDGNTEIFLYEVRRRSLIQITNSVSPVDSGSPSIDRSGRRITFLSNGDFLGTNSDGNQEIFLFKRSEGAFVQVTTTISGSIDNAVITANGRYILFDGDVDLTGANGDGNKEVFRYQVETGTIEQLTHTTSGGCEKPFPSANGRFVVFQSESSDISGANADEQKEIYLLDTKDGSFRRITDYGFQCVNPVICGDGKYVAFESAGDPLGTNGDGSTEIFLVHVEDALETTQLTSGAAGTSSRNATLDNTGKRISFQSDANLTGAGSGFEHIFLHVRP